MLYVWLFIALLVCIVFGWLSYRAFLESQVRAGTHPNMLKGTLIVIFIGLFLVIGFFLVPTIGVGLLITILVLFILITLLFAFSTQVILSWVALFFIAGGLVIALHFFGIL